MTYNVLWAAVLAMIIGGIINGFAAGVLSLTTRESWLKIWARLCVAMVFACLIGLLGTAFSTSHLGTIFTIVVCILLVSATGVLPANKFVFTTGILVAAISVLIGQSAATGNIARTEMLMLFGGIGGMLVAGIWGILRLYYKEKGPL